MESPRRKQGHFDRKRLEKLTLSRQALSFEVESTRSSRWNVRPDADLEATRLRSPRPSPPRVSLDQLRTIQTLVHERLVDEEQPQQAANEDTLSQFRERNLSEETGMESRTQGNPFPPSPTRLPVFTTADRSTLDALADLGRRLSRESRSPILLETNNKPYLVSDRHAKTRNVGTSVSTEPSDSNAHKSQLSSPTSDISDEKGVCYLEEVSSTNGISCPSLASHHSSAADALETSSQAPTVTFLSRLLFGTPHRTDETPSRRRTTPKPSSPVLTYSPPLNTPIASSDNSTHGYLLQLGLILGHSRSHDGVRATDGTESTTSSISSLERGLLDRKKAETNKFCWFRRIVQLALLGLLILHWEYFQFPFSSLAQWREFSRIDEFADTWVAKTTAVRQVWMETRARAVQEFECACSKGGTEFIRIWKTFTYPLIVETCEMAMISRQLIDEQNLPIRLRSRMKVRSKAMSHVQWCENDSSHKALILGSVVRSWDGALAQQDSLVTEGVDHGAVASRRTMRCQATLAHLKAEAQSIMSTNLSPMKPGNPATDLESESPASGLTIPGGDECQPAQRNAHAPTHFWHSSHLGAPFLSLDPNYNPRKTTTRPAHINQSCFLASLVASGQCQDSEQLDFCCESDWTNAGIFVASLEEALGRVVEESERTLMDLVRELFNERRRRRRRKARARPRSR